MATWISWLAVYVAALVRASSSSKLALASTATDILSTHAIAGYGFNRKITRLLQQDDGDFDRLNELLEGVSINIEGDMIVSEKIGFTNLELVIDSLVCRDISIGTLAVNHNTESNVVDVNLAFNGVNAACDIVYQYDYGFLDGTAKAEIITQGNAADTSMRFVTSNQNGEFFVESSVTNCVVDVEISDVNFIDADFATTIVGLFEPYLRDLIESEIEGYACSELSTTGVSFLNDELFTLIDTTLTDFLTGEDNAGEESSPLVPNGYDVTNALNFQEIRETEIGELFERALNQIDERFGGNGGDSLGINSLLRSYVLDENGVLVLNIDDFLGPDALTFELHDKLTKTRISLNEVRIYGLDTMTKFDPFMVVGDHTLRNEFSWKTLNMEVDITLDMQPSSLDTVMLRVEGDDSKQESITEQITVRVGAENIDVVATIFALIESEALSSFTIGSVLSLTNTEDYSWLLPCLMSAVQQLRFTKLVISPEVINAPTLEGFLDDGVDRILSDLAEITFEVYHGVFVDDVLPNMFQNTIKTFVNEQINLFLVDTKSNPDPCPKFDEGDSGEYVDFREFFDPSFSTGGSVFGQLPSMLRELLDTQLLQPDPTTGMPKINEVLMDPLTKGQSGVEGTLMFGGDGGDIFNIVQRINVGGFDAKVRLRASDVVIENLNTLASPLVLLETDPTEPYYLNNSLTVGIEERPVTMSARFAFAVIDEVGGTEISNEIDISFDMHTANMIATLMLKIAKSKLLDFPLVDVMDLNCWIATIPAPALNDQGIATGEDEVTAAIVDFAASVANLNLNMTCVECSSPGIIEMSELLMSSSEAQNDVTLLANTLLLFAADMVKGDLLQVPLDRLLNDASKQCPHGPTYDPNFIPGDWSSRSRQYREFDEIQVEDSAMYLIIVGAIFLGLVLLVAALAFSIRFITFRRHRRWLSKLPREQVEALKHIQKDEDSLEHALNSTTQSMFRSGDQIPCLVRWGMPIVILGNIALFLSGHLNLGATVNIEATIAGETIKVDEFFEFSVARSTIDIWNAGGKALAILILIFSGIWPYTKQVITLILWFTPTSWIRISRRGSFLVWLDRLGKWSMIDIFVLIVCLAAFRVSVKSPTTIAFLPEGFYSLDLLVVPLWGLYANLIAQLVSQISSHFIIHYHRKIAKKAHDSYDKQNGDYLQKASDDGDEKTVLRTHQFGRPHRGEEEKLGVRSWTNSLLTLLVVCLIAFIIAGCILPSFAVEVFGLIGVAVEAGQEFREAITYHSVFTVIKLLFEEAQFLDTVKDYIGLCSFSVIFAITVLLMPIIQSGVLLLHWFVPMTMQQRRRMSVLNEILQAWQYAEVYIIAIFVASWQLGPISSFMVNSYCGSLDSFFSELVFYGILKTEDAQCFSVKSSIEEGFFILAAGAVLLALVNTFITKATHQYFRDQDEPMRQRQIKEISSRLESAEEGLQADTDLVESTVRPVPVLFTDTFRWLLIQDDANIIITSTCESSSDSVGDDPSIRGPSTQNC